jgi:2-keto-4-pentenoate hydratase/2-oxohepta-3-ene-1,7-dioic acid hydratase in catechol pathway
MKIAATVYRRKACLAAQRDGAWYDLTAAIQVFRQLRDREPGEVLCTIESLIQTGRCSDAYLNSVFDFLEQHDLLREHTLPEPKRFLLPLRPGKIVALGRNYAAHAAETGHDAPAEPIIFAKSPTSCIGHDEEIVLRDDYGRVDHEVELALIIGKRAKEVPVDAAREYIAGYTILNDVTARDLQKRDIDAGHPWFRSKSLDTFGPLGPVVVTPGDLDWPLNVDLECRVNGEARQKSTTNRFIFPVPELVSFITRHMTLEPGDVISTGTPEGISPIAAGDVVEAEIAGIGVLRNPVVAG